MSVPAAFLTARPAAASTSSGSSSSSDGGAGFGTALEAAAEALPGTRDQSGADTGSASGDGAANTSTEAAAAAGLPFAAAPVLDGLVLPTGLELQLQTQLAGADAAPAESEGTDEGSAVPDLRASTGQLPSISGLPAGTTGDTAAGNAAATAAAAPATAAAAAAATAAAAAAAVQAGTPSNVEETSLPPAAPGERAPVSPSSVTAAAVPAEPAAGAIRADQVPAAPASPVAGTGTGNQPTPAATEAGADAVAELGKAGPPPAQPAAPAMAAPAVSVPPVQVAAPAPVPAPAPAQPAPFLAQVSQPLFSLSTASAGEHVMTLSVTPENLGPVTVRAHVSADGIRVELFAPNDAGREALRTILTDLRRDLSGAGMNTSLSLSTQDQPGAETDGRGETAESGTGRHRAEADAAPLPVQQIFRSVEHGPHTTLDILA